MKSRLLCAASLAALLLPAGAAFADDAATSVDELVVTGEKARRSLQDTVASGSPLPAACYAMVESSYRSLRTILPSASAGRMILPTRSARAVTK